MTTMRNSLHAALFTARGFALTFSAAFVAGMLAMVHAARLI